MPEAASKQLSPSLKKLAGECLPVQQHTQSSKPAKEIINDAPTDPDEILTQLAEGVLNPQAAKLTFLSMIDEARYSR